jgi:hypothetical protein
MVQAAERKLCIASTLAFKLSKRMKTALPVFAMNRDRKIQIRGKTP